MLLRRSMRLDLEVLSLALLRLMLVNVRLVRRTRIVSASRAPIVLMVGSRLRALNVLRVKLVLSVQVCAVMGVVHSRRKVVVVMPRLRMMYFHSSLLKRLMRMSLKMINRRAGGATLSLCAAT
jgi:hypothetical protein